MSFARNLPVFRQGLGRCRHLALLGSGRPPSLAVELRTVGFCHRDRNGGIDPKNLMFLYVLHDFTLFMAIS